MQNSIDRIIIRTVAVPFEKDFWLGTKNITSREFIVTEVFSGDISGWGYGFSRGAPILPVAAIMMVPLLLGQSAMDSRCLYSRMRNATALAGSGGIAARAVSAMDMALWDLKARLLKRPLCNLLGADVGSLAMMIPSGYRPTVGVSNWFAEEMEHCSEFGAARVKLMLTPEEWKKDADKLVVARDILGKNTLLGNDFHSNGKSVSELAGLIAATPDGVIDFIEDPFPAHRLQTLRQFRDSFAGEIITGELVDSLHAGRELCHTGAVDLVRWDATLCGGVTGWMDLASLASAYDLNVIPHCFPEIHAHLCLATGNEVVESTIPAHDTIGFRRLLKDPHRIEAGRYHLDDRPGIGPALDCEKVSMLTTEIFDTQA